ncbi:hypothetical protein TSUD_244650 [Trifolium subterraneum]|uniref:Uncharacterized protein n=1 Tax=Trifolium subterraneum TaxID=3900 RepID=A0A2Z6PNZ0_TRISU|nr:hypothetical protein TSUD_244650 [Trifolium subterraneum]
MMEGPATIISTRVMLRGSSSAFVSSTTSSIPSMIVDTIPTWWRTVLVTLAGMGDCVAQERSLLALLNQASYLSRLVAQSFPDEREGTIDVSLWLDDDFWSWILIHH